MDRPLVIFDYDGVIVDTVAILCEGIRTKVGELGYDMPLRPEDMLDLFEDNIIVALIERGLTPNHMCEVWEHLQKVSREAKVHLFAGIGPMLEKLSASSAMAIVSTSDAEVIREGLRNNGVLHHFSRIYGGDDELSKVVKIRRCMDEAESKPKKTIYIGDTVGDIREAREAGVMPVGVAWGLDPVERLREESPEFVVMEPSEIVDLINAIA